MKSPELHSVKTLAAALDRSRVYVWAMKRAGFVMPGGRATLDEARQWLRERPQFGIKWAYLTPANLAEIPRALPA